MIGVYKQAVLVEIHISQFVEEQPNVAAVFIFRSGIGEGRVQAAYSSPDGFQQYLLVKQAGQVAGLRQVLPELLQAHFPAALVVPDVAVELHAQVVRRPFVDQQTVTTQFAGGAVVKVVVAAYAASLYLDRAQWGRLDGYHQPTVG